jgi:amino acid transporter
MQGIRPWYIKRPFAAAYLVYRKTFFFFFFSSLITTAFNMGEKNEFYEVHTDLPLKENRTAAGETVDENEQLRRGLKSRHVQLIALGGCIGTGLFVGSGAILSNSGPASLLLAYIIMSSIIWTVMNALGEMTTYLPLHGVSPPLFVYKYADTSLAFATGWNYWYAYAFLVPSEVTASAIIVEYWTDKVPTPHGLQSS